MQPFHQLLRAAIDRRFKTDASFAEAVGVKGAWVSLVVRGFKPPSPASINQWADALGLFGNDRRDFLLAADVANSPQSVTERLEQLEAIIAAQREEMDLLKDRLLQALTRLQSKPAARRRAR